MIVQIALGLVIFAAVACFIWGAVHMLGAVGAQAGAKYKAGVSETAEAAWLRITPDQVVALSLLSGFAMALLVLLLSQFWILAFAAGLAGLSLPSAMLRVAKRNRDALFGAQLVDALGNMSNSLKAGFSLPQAFDLIAREMQPPIRQEFSLVTQEMRLGLPMEKALGNLLNRMRSQDLDLVVSSIDVSREVGGNLTEVFQNISGTIRERQRVEGKIRMLSAQGRLQGVIMTLLPVVVAIAIGFVSPGYMDPLYEEKIGWLLLAVMGVMLVIGGFVIQRILAIDI